MSKIKQLSKQQLDQLAIRKDYWIGQALSTDRQQNDEAIKIVKRLYSDKILTGKAPTYYIVLDSPLGCWIGLNLIVKYGLLNQVEQIGQQVEHQVWQQVEQIRHQVEQQVLQQIRKQVLQVEQQIRQQVLQQARQVGQQVEQIRHQVEYQAWQQVEQIREQVEHQVEQQIREQVEQQVEQIRQQVEHQARQEVEQFEQVGQVEQQVRQEVLQQARQVEQQVEQIRQQVEQIRHQVEYQAWQQVEQFEQVGQVEQQAWQQFEQIRQVEQQVRQEVLQKIWQARQVGQQVWQVGQQARQQVEQQIRQQVLQQARQVGQQVEQIRQQVGQQARQQIRQQFEQQVWQVRQQVEQVEQQIRQQIEQQIRQQFEQQVWQVRQQVGQIGQQVGQQVEQQIRQQVWQKIWQARQVGQIEIEPFYWPYLDGYYWASYCFYCEAIRDIVGVKNLPSNINALLEVIKVGLIYPMDDFVIIGSHPHQLHLDSNNRLHSESGAAIEWQDGYKFYSWHGVTVDEYIIMRPGEITIDKIQSETNAEVRRVMIERFGEVRYIQESGLHATAHDERWGTIYLEKTPFGRPIARLKVINRTPESDGSFKTYWLAFNPDCYGGDAGRIPQAAVASTWRTKPGGTELFFKDWKDYCPAIET